MAEVRRVLTNFMQVAFMASVVKKAAGLCNLYDLPMGVSACCSIVKVYNVSRYRTYVRSFMMGKLKTEMVSNLEINAIYFGLILSGYEYSSIEKSSNVLSIINDIITYPGLDDIKQYFARTRQKTCEAYPFWPRAALLETATFFIDNEGLSFDAYADYVNSRPNLSVMERDEDFFLWVQEFPKYLKVIKTNRFFREINKRLSDIVTEIAGVASMDVLELVSALDLLANGTTIDVSSLSVAICPLKCIYSADYYVSGAEMSVILGDFLPHSIIHEYMHLIVHPNIFKYKESILSIPKSKQLTAVGTYDISEATNSFIYDFEECIVRTATNLVLDKSEVNIEQIIQSELDERCKAV
jgi:hypothetical protein